MATRSLSRLAGVCNQNHDAFVPLPHYWVNELEMLASFDIQFLILLF
jgi:hypothetical protein